MQKQEIQIAEIGRYIPELQQALDDVCQSQSFRTSPKSCEFLRHIVHHTLNHQIDELKERLIGIDLLGRETTYDTGSDAGVRVRANDVRKRLLAYHAACKSDDGYTFELPAGAYVPRFFRSVPAPPEIPSLEEPPIVTSIAPEQATALSLRQLAMPTLIALFLCTICMRWQIAQEHPFTTFWQTVFQDHHATFYMPPVQMDGQESLVSIDSLEASAPLFNLAGQFHARLPMTRTLSVSASSDDIVISIGGIPAGAANPKNLALASTSTPWADDNRISIEDTAAGREVVDRDAASHSAQLSGRAGLITIVNGPQRIIRVDGTDQAAIGNLIEMLCNRDSFPADLANSFQEGTVTQVVFPIAPHAEPLVFREPLPGQVAAVRGE
jgi:hypothetical protein